MTVHIVWMGALITLIAGGVGLAYWSAGRATWQTMIFSTLAFCQVVQALAVRSQHESLFTLGLFSNKPLFGLVVLVLLLQLGVLYIPFMDAFLNVESLTLLDITISLGLGSLVLVVSEVEKAFIRRRVVA
jgi:Ca2+-transporting ATPase